MKLAQPCPRVNPPSCLVLVSSLSFSSTCPSEGWWEHHPDTCFRAAVSAFIFHCQAQITRPGLCTRRRGKCRVCWSFVNRHTFCERWCEWDEVTNCWSSVAVAEGKGWPEAEGILDCPFLKQVRGEWDSKLQGALTRSSQNRGNRKRLACSQRAELFFYL